MMETAQPEGDETSENPWKRLSRTVAYQNPWIIVYHDEVLRPDGQPGIYGVVHYLNQAVAVILVDEQDRVLLVGQYRYTLDAYSWEIPEGGAGKGETLLAAAQRELREETGYSAEQWQEIATLHLSNSVSDERAVCYLATGLQVGLAEPEGTERLQLRWLPFSEALTLCAEGGITDVLTVVALQRVALMRET